MPFSGEDLGLGVGVPFLVAAVVALIWWFLPFGKMGTRHGAAWAFGIASLIGYGLVELGPWLPDKNRDFLIYGVIAAAFLGPLAVAEGVNWFERVVAFAVWGVVSAWLFVPDWAEPSREIWLLATAATIMLNAVAFEVLAKKEVGARFPLLLTFVLVVTSAFVMLSGSARYAQIVLAMVGSMIGLSLAALIGRSRGSLQGLGLAYATGTAGMLTISHLDSFAGIPLGCFIILAFGTIPLTIWALTSLQSTKGWKGWIAPGLIVLTVGVTPIAWAYFNNPGLFKVE